MKRHAFLLRGPIGLLALAISTLVPNYTSAQEPVLPNAQAEAAELQRLALSLDAFQKALTNARRAGTEASYRALLQTSATTKEDLRRFQPTFENLRRRLKEHPLWANFDQEFEARARRGNAPPELLATVRREGGARAVIEKASMTAAVADIDNDVEQVRPRGAAEAVIEAIVGQPVSAAPAGFVGCVAQTSVKVTIAFIQNSVRSWANVWATASGCANT